MEDQKPWSGWALKREFSKGMKTPVAGQFYGIFLKKKAILMLLDHISHVFKTI